MTKDSDFRFCEMWQQDSGEPPRFTPEELHGRITKFERTIKRRNLREYIAAVLVIVRVLSGRNGIESGNA